MFLAQVRRCLRGSQLYMNQPEQLMYLSVLIVELE